MTHHQANDFRPSNNDPSSGPPPELFDILIVGAGVSGIGIACHLKMSCPEKSIVILERRDSLGGTWDLFHYPGIRSDSDMLTFGYEFRPWTQPKILADGPSIKQYISDTAKEYGVDKLIRFRTKATHFDWSSSRSRWIVTTTDETSGSFCYFECRFVVHGSGYYRYESGFRPDFPGEARFTGQIIHPQLWPTNFDCRDKNVVVIGSGATAVTLVPALAGSSRHVTMLQRSPTYIISLPAIDLPSKLLSYILPARWVYRLARKRNIFFQQLLYLYSRRWPNFFRKMVLMGVRFRLGSTFDLSHFSPAYDPWDQRLCIIPDWDLFDAIKQERASIVTDQIETFTENGVKLKSGKELAADVIISATGLEIQSFGGAAISVDGQEVALNQRLTYKSVLIEGIPNTAAIIGYVNASWTLKVDIAGRYLCRLFHFMDQNGYTTAIARDLVGCKTEESVMNSLKSGYVQRGSSQLPRQGSSGAWKVSHNYLEDRKMLLHDTIDDGVLQFS